MKPASETHSPKSTSEAAFDKRLIHRILYTLTLLAFGILYAPQPILPALAAEFSSTSNQAALLTTAVMLPLAIAPLSYGYILEKVPAKKGLQLSCIIMMLCHLAFSFISSIEQAILIRAIEGMTLPIMLTSIMTLLTRTTSKEKLQKTLSIYIALTIVGGLSGRSLSMMTAEYLDWRYTFLLLAFFSLILLPLLAKLPDTKPQHAPKVRLRLLINILSHPYNRFLYPFIMIQFFIMVAILNFIPFRIMEALNTDSYWPVFTVYSFYIAAIATSLLTIEMRKKVTHLQFKGGIGWIIVGTIGLSCFYLNNLTMYCLGFTLCCGAIFAIHSITSTEVNSNEQTYSGLSNGTYLTFYYTGGTLGSIIPGLIIEQADWETTVTILGILMLASSLLLFKYQRAAFHH